MSLSSVSVGGNGMGLTPSPATTPKSWNHTGGSSVGGAVGQMGTKIVRGGRGLVIAGVATLIVGAGAGGFVIANNMGKSEITHVGAPNPLEATMSNDQPNPPPMKADPTPAPAAPSAPVKPDTAAAVGTAIKVDPPKADAPKVDATKTVAVKTDTTKTDAAKSAPKTDATKTVAKSTPKTDATKATTKSTTPKSTTKSTKPKDDLFDDRH
jgi:hypothetical protein